MFQIQACQESPVDFHPKGSGPSSSSAAPLLRLEHRRFHVSVSADCLDGEHRNGAAAGAEDDVVPEAVPGREQRHHRGDNKLSTNGNNSSSDDDDGDGRNDDNAPAEDNSSESDADGDGGETETWRRSLEGFIKFLVDSRLVFDTLERIVDESNGVAYAYFRKTGLERSKSLSGDLEWFKQQGNVIPEPSNPGVSYAKYLEGLAEHSAPLFLCHFYKIYFSHIAGGQVIARRVLFEFSGFFNLA
ncbi:probable inactive heme oxygenase 2, chloroplastic [Pyrus x bretschneideri]|uniref:probable inactive heme oxygenase 2, chloroplastic n=1 Tax=Pyrus x bretschneideri TaxID=225117 RepID=UPI00202FC323|nr:probable inactive heme oxygenase 2, chloroplastic [Pyrus x bretschneideri]